jgi:hypothetical protein
MCRDSFRDVDARVGEHFSEQGREDHGGGDVDVTYPTLRVVHAEVSARFDDGPWVVAANLIRPPAAE